MADDKVSLQKTAKRLRAVRGERHMTQVEVAKKAGISETYYAQIERAEKNPTTTVILSIIDALGVTSADIFGK